MTEYWKKEVEEHELTKGYYETLKKIIEIYNPKTVLEIGMGWGVSGSAFMEYPVEFYKTVDPNVDSPYGKQARIEIALRKLDSTRTVFVEGKSQDILPKLIENKEKFDMIYIDGDHAYNTVHGDLFFAHHLLNPNGKIVLDDYLHEGNLVEGKRNCGVFEAVRDYLLEYRKTAKIYPHNRANGFAVI